MQAGAEFRAWLDRHFPVTAKDRRGGRGCAPSQIKRAAAALDRSPRTIAMYASGTHYRTGKPVHIPDEVARRAADLEQG